MERGTVCIFDRGKIMPKDTTMNACTQAQRDWL